MKVDGYFALLHTHTQNGGKNSISATTLEEMVVPRGFTISLAGECHGVKFLHLSSFRQFFKIRK